MRSSFEQRPPRSDRVEGFPLSTAESAAHRRRGFTIRPGDILAKLIIDPTAEWQGMILLAAGLDFQGIPDALQAAEGNSFPQAMACESLSDIDPPDGDRIQARTRKPPPGALVTRDSG